MRRPRLAVLDLLRAAARRGRAGQHAVGGRRGVLALPGNFTVISARPARGIRCLAVLAGTVGLVVSGAAAPVLAAPTGPAHALGPAAASGAAGSLGAPFGPAELQNLNGLRCLTVFEASMANNANVNQYTCEGETHTNQDWLLYYEGSYFEVQNQHSGKCLTVFEASTANNANVNQYFCEAHSNQLWYPQA